MIQKTDMQSVSLPNKLPLNDNDFLHEKKAHEITQIVNLSPPYTISITTLQETKLNISKIENTKIQTFDPNVKQPLTLKRPLPSTTLM